MLLSNRCRYPSKLSTDRPRHRERRRRGGKGPASRATPRGMRNTKERHRERRNTCKKGGKRSQQQLGG
eukprot:2337339-Amphidinium_carterae.1